MHYRLFIAFSAIICTVIVTRAADLDILEGYGETRWGQTVEEVSAVVPNLEKFDAPGNQYNAAYVQAGEADGILRQTRYEFFADRLFQVVVTLVLPDAPEHSVDQNGADFVNERIEAKYGNATKELAAAGIQIKAVSGGSGSVTVAYANLKAQDEAVAVMQQKRAEAQAAAEREFREGKRLKKLAEAGIDDLL